MRKKLLLATLGTTLCISLAALVPIVGNQLNAAASGLRYQNLKSSSDGSTTLDIDSVSHKYNYTTNPINITSCGVSINADLNMAHYAQTINSDNTNAVLNTANLASKKEGTLDGTTVAYHPFWAKKGEGTTSDGKWHTYTYTYATPYIEGKAFAGYNDQMYNESISAGIACPSRSSLYQAYGLRNTNQVAEQAAFFYLGFTADINITSTRSDINTWKMTTQKVTDTDFQNDSVTYNTYLLEDPQGYCKIKIDNLKLGQKGKCGCDGSYSGHVGFNSNYTNSGLNTNGIHYSAAAFNNACGVEGRLNAASKSNVVIDQVWGMALDCRRVATSGGIDIVGGHSALWDGSIGLFDITIYEPTTPPNTAPTVSINSIPNQHYDPSGHNVTISGTASDANGDAMTVDVYLGNTSNKVATVNVSGSGSWSTTISTQGMGLNSTQYVYAIASDGKATSSTASRTFSIYNTSPSVTINSISNIPYNSSMSNVSISGRWSDSDSNPKDTVSGTFSLDGTNLGSISVSSNGTWTATIPGSRLTSMKQYTVQVYVTDGIISSPVSTSTTFSVINASPTITPTKTSGTVMLKDYKFDVQLNDSNAGQTLTYSYSVGSGSYKTLGSVSSTGSAITRSNNTIPLSELSMGNNTINLKVSDGTAEGRATINVNRISPSLTLAVENLPDQQFTTDSNIVKFIATLTYNGEKPTTTFKFNGAEVPASNIVDKIAHGLASYEDTPTGSGTYEISIDTAGLPIKDGYVLEVTSDTSITDAVTKTATVDVVNTAPTIAATISSDKVIYGSDNSFDVPVTVEDVNIGQNMSVEYRINEGEWTNANINFVNTGSKSATVTVPVNVSMAGKSIKLQFRTFDTLEYGYDNGPGGQGYTINIKKDAKLMVHSAPDQQYTEEENLVTFECESAGENLTVTAVFNGNLVPANNISSIDSNGNFTVQVDTAGLSVSETSYELEVTASDGTSAPVSNTGTVRILNTAPAIKATIDNNKVIYVSESALSIPVAITDPNIGQDMTISYSINDGEWTDANVNYENTGSKNTTVSIPIADFSGETIKIKLRVYDTIDYGYDNGNNGDGYTVIVKDDASVVVSDAPDQQYTTNPNIVKFECQSTGSDLTVSATFNGSPVSLTNISSIGTNGKFTVSVDTANLDISETPYSLEVTVNDGTSDSVSDMGTVKVINTAPSIEATISPDEKGYVSNGYILIPVNVEDPNIGQNINVSYKINNGEWEDSDVSYTNQGTYSGNVKIPLSIDMLGSEIKLAFRTFDGFDYGYDNGVANDGFAVTVLGEEEEIDITVGEVTEQQYTTNSNPVAFNCNVNIVDSTITAVFNGQHVPNDKISSIGQDGSFTITIDTGSLPVSDTPYKLSVTATSKYESSITEDGFVKVVNTVPNIKAASTDDDLKYTTEENMHFTIDTSDLNIGQKIALSYSLNGTDWIPLDEEWTNDGSTKTTEIALPANIIVPDGNPVKIIFRASDGIGYSTSSAQTVTVKYPNNAPDVVIADFPENIEEDKEFEAVIESTDKDKDDVIKIYRQIDGGKWELIETYTSDGNRYTINDTIPGLNPGQHEVIYKSVDEEGKTDTDKKSFEVIVKEEENHAPEIKITDVPEEIEEDEEADIVVESLDKDKGDIVAIYRRVDLGGWKLIVTYTSDGTAHIINDKLPPLSPGNHDVVYQSKDQDGKTSEAKVTIESVQSKPVDGNDDNNYPELYITDMTDSVRIGEYAEFTLKVKDQDVGQDLWIYYELDDGKEVLVDDFTSKGKSKTIEVTIEDVEIGKHKIVFYAVDDKDAHSNADGNIMIEDYEEYEPSKDRANAAEFEIMNTPPTISIVDCPDKALEGEDVTISVKVNDIDEGQKLTVYYVVDNLWPVKVGEYISTGIDIPVEFTVKDLELGPHKIRVYSEDELGARSDVNGDLNSTGGRYDPSTEAKITIEPANQPENHNPEIDIPNQKTDFTEGDDIAINITVTDKDVSQKVEIHCSINDEDGKVIDSFISDGTPQSITGKLGELDNGRYVISFWAIDELGGRSDGSDDASVNPADSVSKVIITVNERPAEPVKTGVETSKPTNKGGFAAVCGIFAMVCGAIVSKRTSSKRKN